MKNNFTTSSAKDLENYISNKRISKIFLLTGKNSFFKSGAYKKLNKKIIEKKIKIYFKKDPNPNISELKRIFKVVKNFKPDLILAIGGGSVLDYAKIVNVLDDITNLNDDILNGKCVLKKQNHRLLAIPTTAGSGAEATSTAVIYINNKKYSIEGNLILPNDYFLIPEFIKNANQKIKASAGFDAIAQALESLISKKSNTKSIEFALNSLEYSLKYYIKFLNNPNNDNTYAMTIASHLAGKAINISRTTAPHAISYPFTARYNISHGHAVSLTLEKFFNFNYVNKEMTSVSFDLNKRFLNIFEISKTNNINNFCNFIKNIKLQAGLQTDFKKLGIDIKKDLNKIISGVNSKRLSNNPVYIEKSDLREILLSEKY